MDIKQPDTAQQVLAGDVVTGRSPHKRAGLRRRASVGAVTSLMLAVGTVTGVSAAAADGSATAAAPTVTRLAGADRYATAAAIARANYPLGPNHVVDVVVARGDAFPDALSAVNITGARYGGPAALLLSGRNALSADGAAFVDASDYDHARIMGTQDVLSEAIFTRVQSAARRGGTTYRVGGRDRYATNFSSYVAAYNAEADVPASVDGKGTAFLVSGTSYADAISAGPVSSRERVPLLLTDPSSLSSSVREILTTYRLGITQVVVVGGPQAVNDGVLDQLRALGITVRRVAGADRQATSVAIADFAQDEFGWSAQHVTLARGDNFADAIAGATYAGDRKSPIMLTSSPNVLGATAHSFFASHAGAISGITVLGDSTAVSDAVVAEAVGAS